MKTDKQAEEETERSMFEDNYYKAAATAQSIINPIIDQQAINQHRQNKKMKVNERTSQSCRKLNCQSSVAITRNGYSLRIASKRQYMTMQICRQRKSINI